MPDSAPVIEVHDLQKTYRDGFLGRKKVEALRGASLEVGAGEIFGLLGPNGAGKTTMIKILLGIVRKTDGSASMLGKPAGDRAVRKRVGYLPENHRIPQHLTGNTALEYFGGLSNMPLAQIRERRPEALARVGLTKWGKTPVKKYSKGMQQRLGLAQAMLHDPDLLILDEPTDGVDPKGRSEIRKILKNLKDEGKTIFLNSHLLQELELICDRVAILGRGRVRKSGAVSELTEGASAGVSTAGGVDAPPRVEILLNLEGEEPTVRAALSNHETTSWESVADRRFQIGVPVEGQPAVDALIDELRGRGVSIYQMTRRKLTLEEAFLELFENETDDLAD